LRLLRSRHSSKDFEASSSASPGLVTGIVCPCTGLVQCCYRQAIATAGLDLVTVRRNDFRLLSEQAVWGVIARRRQRPGGTCHSDGHVMTGRDFPPGFVHSTDAMSAAEILISNVVPPRPATLPVHSTVVPSSVHRGAPAPFSMKCPL
jgi:hypothetical protein